MARLTQPIRKADMQKQTIALTSIIAVGSSIHLVPSPRTISPTFLTLRSTVTSKDQTAAAITIFYKAPISNHQVLLFLPKLALIIMRMKRIHSALCLPALQEKDSVIITTAARYLMLLINSIQLLLR